jgi:uncharacterized oxidoreductase
MSSLSVDSGSVVLEASVLEALGAAILQGAGASSGVAAMVSESLVLSNLKGADSHGIMRVLQYVGEIESGKISPLSLPDVKRDNSFISVDGMRGFGHIAARAAEEAAIAVASQAGLSVATVYNVRHVGRLGEYVELAATAGFIQLAFCNTGPPFGRVAPYGGAESRFGTNPIAFGLPSGSGPPVVADFSSSAVAEGRIRLALQKGEALPDGLIVDSLGAPSNQPADLYAGGALLPSGGHKGYALALLAEVLGGAIAGAGSSAAGDDPGNGVLFVTFDAGRAAARPEGFLDSVDRILRAVLATPPAPGYKGVMLPGGPELLVERERRKSGVPIDVALWRELAAADPRGDAQRR